MFNYSKHNIIKILWILVYLISYKDVIFLKNSKLLFNKLNYLESRIYIINLLYY